MKDAGFRLGLAAKPREEQGRRWRWLRPGLGLILLMLILGLTMASSAGSNIKAAIRAGQLVGKDAQTRLASADFQFTGQGRILGGVGKNWIISGVPIQVDEHTQIIGVLNVGDSVFLSGQILGSGVWLADRIELADFQEALFTFNGLLVSIETGAWRIGSSVLVVNEQTQVEGELAVNDLVLATFAPLEDGTWLALKIEPFDEPWVEPTPTPTVTPTAAPAVTKEPQKKVAPSVGPEPAAKPPKNQGRTTICHKSGKKGGHTMTVDGPALQSHLRHGDTLGPCR